MVLLGTALAIPPSAALAHSGRTNAEGCHNDRVHGGYHCHGGSRLSFMPTVKAKRSYAARRRTQSLGRQIERRVESLFNGNRAFANCSEARALGMAPVRAGQSGYARHLDRDGDGIGCE